MFLFLYFDEIIREWILMTFILNYIYKTALYLAVEKENIEIIELLLANDKLDINIKVSN